MPSSSTPAPRVLVTGASGYLATHIVRLLLKEGYRVRGTVRSLNNAKKVCNILVTVEFASQVNPVRALDTHHRLELVEGDITVYDGWTRIMDGCDYVLHVASPITLVPDPSIINTAIDGTLNILKAAAATPRVRKVVVTSSGLAVFAGNKMNGHVFSEKDWANVDNLSQAFYPKSKALAERAAWDFVNNLKTGNKFRFTVVCPGWICGPPLVDDQGTSVTLVRRFLENDMKDGIAHVQVPAVDVRDVAKGHVEALKRPESDGERILLVAQPSLWQKDIADVLKHEFGRQGYTINAREISDSEVRRLAGEGQLDMRHAIDRLGTTLQFDNTKAKRLLGMNFHSTKCSIAEMAYFMIERGMVRKTSGYSGMPSYCRM